MAYINLRDQELSKPVIMIFTEGTILKHKSIAYIYDYKSYVPIGDAIVVKEFERIDEVLLSNWNL